MKKKVLLFILTLLIMPFAFMFSGCDSSANSNNNSSDNGNSNIQVEVYIDGRLSQTLTTNEENNYRITAPAKPEDPSAERYFYGWFVDSNYQTPLTEDKTFISNGKIYGKWIYVNLSSFSYSVSQGKATITAFRNNGSTIVVIPSYINSFPVETIASSVFANQTMLRNIIICNGIKEIDANAFSNCNTLLSIEIPKSITKIHNTAFSRCLSLYKIDVDKDNIVYDSRNECNAIIETRTNELIVGCKNTIIPNTVTGIGDYAFCDCSSLTSIEIPNSVTSIGNSAFYSCRELTNVEFKKDSLLTSIGECAFSGCSLLTNITIGNNVLNIGESAFYNCSSLTKVTIFNIENWCRISFESNDSNPLYYAHNLYVNNKLIENIEIPNTITEVKKFAFYGMTCLKSIIIPNSIKSIGEEAFYNCGSLTSIKIPNSVTSLPEGVFSGCSSLIEITLPFLGKNIESLYPLGYIFGDKYYEGSNATKQLYNDGSTYTTYYIPNSLKSVTITGGSINYGVFYNCSGLINIIIQNNTLSIDNASFYNCSSLTYINIPNSVKNIGNYVFYNCSSLTSIIIPNSVVSIGYDTFRGCNSLVNICLPFVGNKQVTGYADDRCPLGYLFGTYSYTGSIAVKQEYYRANATLSSTTYYIPISLKSVTITGGNINYGAFYNCTNLTSITIDNNVTNIGDYAFYNCKGLKTITVGNSVRSIGTYAFYDCIGLNSITIGNGITSIRNTAYFNCNLLTRVDYTGTIEDWCKISFGGNYANPLRYAHNLFINNQLVENIKIPNTITEIKQYTFQGMTCLKSITIPNTVTSIGSYAFSGCSSLTSIIIPSNVTSIGSYAFSGCSSLTNAYFMNTNGWETSSKKIYLSNSNTAAVYLTDTYLRYTWTREN